jgi:hypothetical protein
VIRTRLLLLGASGFARETLELARAVNDESPRWRLIGLLYDNPIMHGRRIHGAEVIGPGAAVPDHPDALLAACVASPADPTSRLALTARLGLGTER